MRTWLFISLLIIATACSKSNGSADDTQSPVVTITSPANNSSVTGGQTLNITGTITDNNRIAELHVHISNNNTGTLLIDIHRTPAGNSYSLNENFTTQAGILYKIQVIAKDAAANETISSVLVTAN
jgi:hypothetical protein